MHPCVSASTAEILFLLCDLSSFPIRNTALLVQTSTPSSLWQESFTLTKLTANSSLRVATKTHDDSTANTQGQGNMAHKLTLHSRYGDKRTIIANGHGWYTIEGKSLFYRAGMSDNNTDIAYVDFEGGPLLQIGDDFSGHGKILSLTIEKAEKDQFKVRVEVEQ